MHHTFYSGSFSGWNTIDSFNPFDEYYCFNQCLLDSVITVDYYLYTGREDIDTITVYFKPHSEKYYLLFNGKDARIPEDSKVLNLSSVHYFFKKIKP